MTKQDPMTVHYIVSDPTEPHSVKFRKLAIARNYAQKLANATKQEVEIEKVTRKVLQTLKPETV